MKRFLLLTLCLCIGGCCLFKHTPTVVLKDSVVVHHNYIDSTVIKDSTVIIPIEKIVDIAYDTLKLESSLAVATAWADTTLGVLKGELRNKKEFQTKIVYRDRIQRDTIEKVSIKEVPVEVTKVQYKTPKIVTILALLGCFAFCYGIVKVYRKFFP